MLVPISSSQAMNILGLKASSFYNLIKQSNIEVPQTKSGRYIWDYDTIDRLKTFINKREIIPKPRRIKEYKTFSINNRRYLGNKYKLLDFITSVVNTECSNVNTIADIFSGTGAVAHAFRDKKLITNDLMYFNYICNVAWFSPEKYDYDKITGIINDFNSVEVAEDNYMSINFANTFFSLSDCRKIGYIREEIQFLLKKGHINHKEHALLLCSLIYAMDRIANTCGHYDAYIHNTVFDKKLELYVPEIEAFDNNQNNQCYNEDANALVKRIEADLVYIDPPYNSRQYCDAYHLLENVAKWEKPEVYGTAKKMDRSKLKSNYCTQKATQSFENLINNINAKYILLSYNDMSTKGNERSNAKISDEDIMRILSKKGKVKVFSENYKAFNAGKSDIKDNKERLFLCECYENTKKTLIQSPLNYTGGKYRLLPQLLPNLPNNIDKFVDLFSGGCNVGINVPCNKVIFNDINSTLQNIFKSLRNYDKSTSLSMIDNIIKEYKLSNSSEFGYKYYNCDSKSGLGSYNLSSYLKLRNDFNKGLLHKYDYYIALFVLIVFSFNNQIRFNKKGEFNLPVGKRDFNDKMRNKLSVFIDRLKCGDYTFISNDFRNVPTDDWDEGTFVYVDPPYLITCASYNEQGGWTEAMEHCLLNYLDNLHKRGIRFALSNVLSSKGKENSILKKWLKKNEDKYRTIYLNYSYANSNYQKRNKNSNSEEVLIVNY